MKNAITPIPADSGVFIKLMRVVLRPLIKLLLRQGISYPFFSDLTKSLYVEVAAELTRDNATDSRISLLSGVNRKEVKRIRADELVNDQLSDDDTTHKLQQASIGAQLISSWLSHVDLLNESGHPLPLSRTSRDENIPSFDSLVRSVTKDVHPRSILDDWISRGLATLDAQDRVCLTQQAYVPSRDADEKLFFAQKNLGAHFDVVSHNLDPVTLRPMFERSVYYHNLPPEAVAELSLWAHQQSMQMLIELNKRAQALAIKDADGKVEPKTLHLGVYVYRSDLINEIKS